VPREPGVGEDLREEPAGVATRSGALLEGFLAALHAGLEADRVADVLGEASVHVDEKVDGAPPRAALAAEPALEKGSGLLQHEVGSELVPESRLVLEGELLGVVVEKEVEGVDDGEVRDEVDLDRELRRLLREDQPGEKVAERILLPVDEVLPRLYRERVGSDRSW